MLDFLKGKRKGNCIGSPCKGKAVALTEVPDPTFSEKILGDGFAVIPSEGKIYAPADGEVTVVFDTLHAITMTTDQGAELLIHIGLDTVTLIMMTWVMERSSSRNSFAPGMGSIFAIVS